MFAETTSMSAYLFPFSKKYILFESAISSWNENYRRKHLFKYIMFKNRGKDEKEKNAVHCLNIFTYITNDLFVNSFSYLFA